MTWENILKIAPAAKVLRHAKKDKVAAGARVAHAAVDLASETANAVSNDEDDERKAQEDGFIVKSILEKIDAKKKKKIKEALQDAAPTGTFTQQIDKISTLMDEFKSMGIYKTDDAFKKKMEGFEEKNLEMVASAASVGKQYETLYGEMRELVYPKKNKEEKK
tara:strand:+ start:310 stop:798 length:489 start_codon:yes stop_codon:yes gene_type:complete